MLQELDMFHIEMSRFERFSVSVTVSGKKAGRPAAGVDASPSSPKLISCHLSSIL